MDTHLSDTISTCSRKSYYWTTPELKILRQYYPGGGYEAVRSMLPNRGDRAVYSKAVAEGLKFERGYQRRIVHKTSAAIDAEITRVYASKPEKNAIKDLANRICRPRWWTSRRASELGLVIPRFKPVDWTKEELDIVARNASLSTQSIVKALAARGYRRSRSAVAMQIKRRGIDNESVDQYTACGLARLFGVQPSTICRWIASEGLKATPRMTDRTPQQGGDMWQVSRKTLRAWMPAHAQLIDLRKVDRFWFFDLVFEK